MNRVAGLVWIALLCLVPTGASGADWFHQRIEWHAGREAPHWETPVVSPNGKERYRLALIPLWGGEGGIVGMEIFISRSFQSSVRGVPDVDVNLLGKLDGKPHSYVIDLKDIDC